MSNTKESDFWQGVRHSAAILKNAPTWKLAGISLNPKVYETYEGMSGYHVKNIKKGVFGDFSKIVEEFEELQDAQDQEANIMILCELSDLYGAMEGYVEKHFHLTMKDLAIMSNLTKKAFKDGTRISK